MLCSGSLFMFWLLRRFWKCLLALTPPIMPAAVYTHIQQDEVKLTSLQMRPCRPHFAKHVRQQYELLRVNAGTMRCKLFGLPKISASFHQTPALRLPYVQYPPSHFIIHRHSKMTGIWVRTGASNGQHDCHQHHHLNTRNKGGPME